MTYGPMNPPPLTYHCTECDEESPEWDDEPLGLCFYTGRPHGGFGGDPGPCDCGANSNWVCDNCKCSDCGVTLATAVDQDVGKCEACDPPEEPPMTALDVSYARAETMRKSDYL